MFRRRRRTVRVHEDTAGRRIGRAALGAAAVVPLNLGLAGAALGAGVLSRRYGRVSPLKLLRAAGELHPELKGTVKIVRGGMAKMTGPAALGERMGGTRAQRAEIGHAVNTMTRRGSRRRRLVLMARRPWGLKGVGHLGGSPIMSHELGHLADAGRRNFKRGNVSNLGRLREEWRATAHGAKIHRRAGGNRLAYWATTMPAFGSYVTAHPGFAVGMAGAGAATGGRRKGQRRHR